MVKMQVLYEGDLHTIVTHEPSGQTLHTDAPIDNQGKGRNFSPTDLLGASLASCIATVMGIYAEKKGIDLRGMHLEVEKEMSHEGPRRISYLKVQIWMPNPLSKKEQEMLDKIAKTCPVHNSLHSNTKVDILIHWKD